jgi:hypothetical protein
MDLQATNPASNKENLPRALDPQRKRSTPQLNRMPSTIKKGMWMNEALETTMDVVERVTPSLRKVNKSWNIPMSSSSNHLNGKIRSNKMGPKKVLTEEKDSTLIAWTLAM